MPIKIIVPPLSQTMDTLTLLEWFKNPGDPVQKGEQLFSVETDKATQEVESPASGTLYKIFAKNNEEVKIRSVIGEILEIGEEPQANQMHKEDIRKITNSKKIHSKIIQKNDSYKNGTKRLFASPVAKRMAMENKIELGEVTASGPRGMIVRRDLESHLKNNQSRETTGDSQFRKVISQRMLESHLRTAPVTYMLEVDATPLVLYREKILSQATENLVRLTFTDLFIFIASQALIKNPIFNATYEEEQLCFHSEVNMGIAVDSERGLLVPVIRNVENLTIPEITAKRDSLVNKARSGNLSQSEMTGGTFTLTNLGKKRIDYFTPVINLPQVAILGIGRIRKAPIILNGEIRIRDVVTLNATCDHRFIDGGPAADFVESLDFEIQALL